ncbi:MAG: hypothetical protein AAF384_12635, partial [Pseudomonadota bacterium]
MAIREDRYSQLHQLTDYLPDIVQNRYLLSPITRDQAKEAIEAPAKAKGNFNSVPFAYTPAAIEQILDHLTTNDTQVETTALQIICNRLERLDIPEIRPENIPNVENIFFEFYNGSIQKLPDEQQEKARIFVENQLIQQGQRISLDELVCKNYLPEEVLNQLVNEQHLLRRVRNSSDRVSYEVSHDIMIAPILEAKRLREITEAQIRVEAERFKKEQEWQAQLVVEQAEK